MQRPSQELIRYWYDKLKKRGFKDIEYGRDLNKFSASTFTGRVRLVGLKVRLGNDVTID